MRSAYPFLHPYDQQMLAVDAQHSLYLEQSGNPDGIPVLVLHGGPGAGLGDEYRSLFDPEAYRIIGFEQRGCGRSTPFAELNNNTTQALLDDIQVIRQHLDIKQWVLFGGSWGSTLALLAAQQHPQQVTAMVLRGIFLARQQDVEWFLSPDGGAAQLFPDYFDDFIQPVVKDAQHKNQLEAYHNALTSSNEFERMGAAKAWSLWEEHIAYLHSQPNKHAQPEQKRSRYCLALLECHYIKHGCFISENQILANMHRIQHIPATLVHGRYDAVCKLQSAHTLNQAWPKSRLQIVPKAGHSSQEPGIKQALCWATDALVKFIQEQQQ